MDYCDFHEEFMRQVWALPHHRLKKLSKELCRARESRFPRTGLKVETVERGFTGEELARFLEAIEDETDRAAFMLMASLGLRVGELAALKGKDLEGDRLRVSGAKGGFSGYLRLPPAILSVIPARDQDESLFPASKELRRSFARYRAKAGLTEVYAYGNPGGRARTRRPLFRLSMHSLRHYFIQRVQALRKDIDLTRRAARHRKFDTTMRYLRSSRQEEIEAVLELTSASLLDQNAYKVPVVVKSGMKK